MGETGGIIQAEFRNYFHLCLIRESLYHILKPSDGKYLLQKLTCPTSEGGIILTGRFLWLT
jgi:hypothetical protein